MRLREVSIDKHGRLRVSVKHERQWYGGYLEPLGYTPRSKFRILWNRLVRWARWNFLGCLCTAHLPDRDCPRHGRSGMDEVRV